MQFARFLILFLGLTFSVQASAQQTPDSFADLADKLLPTVVNISAAPGESAMANAMDQMEGLPGVPKGHPFEDLFEEFMQQMPQQRVQPSAMGSGFVIDAENGYIVTNNHVVQDASKVRAIFFNDKSVLADVVGVDDKTDLALLKVAPEDMPPLENAASFGDSDTMRVGDWVLAIGNPFGLGGTVTAGIISARARDINSGPYDDYIQTDASINRGNSGGPMFNTQGEVIGINTAIFSPTGGSVGIGFAIPSNLAKPIIDQLIKYGRTRRGWLGVRIQSVTEEIADSLGMSKAQGALVAEVTAGGPSEKVLKAGDVIISFDGKPIDEMRELPRIVAETDIGKMSSVTVWRNGKKQRFDIKLGELEKAEDDGLLSQNNSSGSAQSDKSTVTAEGLSLSAISESLMDLYEIPSDAQGIVVTKIDTNSAAAAKGIMVGDIITEVNQTPMRTPEDFSAKIEALREDNKSSALLLINRRGDNRFVALKLSEAKADTDQEAE